jgi:methionyl-tRNA formyltransferase
VVGHPKYQNMIHNKKFVFFGSPRFAEIFLADILSSGCIPSLVVCNPDRPVGRKKILTPPPVKVLAEKNNIPVLQLEKLTAEIFKEYNFAVVAAYSKIIPQTIIDNFPNGVIGVHPSLLPTLRGTTPIQSALLSGILETGASLFLIDKEVDHGPLLAEKEIKIEERDNYASLEEKLAHAGAKVFIETIENYLAAKITPKNQNHEKATFTKKFSRDDAFISPLDLENAKNGKDAFLIARKIKAFSTEPGAWTKQGEKQAKLLDCAVRENKLIITKIQIEGKKPQELT